MLLRRTLHFLLILFALLLLASCSREEEAAVQTKPFPEPAQSDAVDSRVAFAEPIAAQRVELASEALAVWRQYSSLQPTLLLLSDIPMILPVPQEIEYEVAKFVTTADQREIARRSHPRQPDLMLFPEMTVDVALRYGWLGQLAWVVPFRDQDHILTADSFRRQLLHRGLASADETQTFSGNENEIRGILRGVPTVITTLEHLPELKGPVLLHIDMSYFEKLYKNEIATPVLNIVFEVLSKLRERSLSTLAVTFSYGNIDERIALDVRFIGDVVKELCEEPDSFLEPVPINWQRQSEILYLINFFKKEKTLELALEQEKELPDAAWVKFNLFRVAADHKKGKEALEYLRLAVELDPVYAMEYLTLADMAYDKGRPDEALRMLQLASEIFPENTMVKIQIAQLKNKLGDHEAAIKIVRELQELPWSRVYHADMPGYLKGFYDFLIQPSSEKSPQDAIPRPVGQSRQKVLHKQ